MTRRFILPSLALVAAFSSAATAADLPDDVLAKGPRVTVTKADYETELDRLPAELRGGFGTNPKRIGSIVSNIVLQKTLSDEARTLALDKDPKVQRLIAQQLDKFLAQLRVEELMKAAGQEFDKKGDAALTAAARERYLVNKEQFRVPEEVRVSHILLRNEKHSQEEATRTLDDLRKKAASGASFADLAKQYSEDEGSKVQGGDLGFFHAGQMDGAFETAAFALKQPGELSPIVKSAFGYHLIRFEARKPSTMLSFDEVKGRIIAEMRDEYMKRARDGHLAEIVNDPKIQVNQPALDSLLVHVDQPEGAGRPGTPGK
jgi:peptidyl-prolyl cis-trans isomerase C